jgi:hypothetical protein
VAMAVTAIAAEMTAGTGSNSSNIRGRDRQRRLQ